MTFVTMTSQRMSALFGQLILAGSLVLPPLCAAADPQRFATPDAAVEAFVAALRANDEAALVSIFGDKYKGLVTTGDAAYDTAVRTSFAAHLASFHVLEEDGDDRRVLLVGAQAWPLPIPLVRERNEWRFATERGAEELINRRIGRNERSAIQVLRAYLDAQREYASEDRDGDGVLQYAQKIDSTPGKFDGLYWPANTDEGEQASPFGPLVAAASAYLVGHKPGDPYRGYYFRILTRQGKNAPGGAYSYLINGRMIAGFAMVAYPAAYDESGIMTFIVSHNGKIFEKNLGPNTARVAANMSSFDPGAGWKETPP
ncbi:DUF2950 domain-containing protein [uncultured Piscinibacter sp.]|uniref:DUF2950 domain-containing protein n=1 Tax=uncultured Piscinibacter sp. TaxID=1131835 RepID=UPI002616CE31|nr:DUF2950 domain-containing protein [uncultured Piscinibacter sp.]